MEPPGWVAAWPDRERLTDAVTPYLLKAADARSGQRIFDVGCGGGALAITLPMRWRPTARWWGSTSRRALLELARQRAAEAGRPNVRFVEVDVQTGPLEPRAVRPRSQPVRRHVLRRADSSPRPPSELGCAPDGRFVFACWQSVERNPWHVGTALRPLLPPPATPPPGKSPVGPFAFGDEEYVRELLEAAGFAAVRIEAHEATVRGPGRGCRPPIPFGLMGVPPDREEEAAARLEAHLAQFAVGPGEFEYPLAFMIFEATA